MPAGYKLASYQGADGPCGGIILGNRIHDLKAALSSTGLVASSVLELLEIWDAAKPALANLAAHGSDSPSQSLDSVTLLPPVLYPRALFCAGANYTDHVAEMQRMLGLPEEGPRKEGDLPWHFVGIPHHSMIGHDASFRMPAYSTKLDWEAEIAIVIGRAARNVNVAEALSYAAGLTIMNDLSARDWVARKSIPPRSPFHWDWVSQKCFEDSKPIGPWIVPMDDIPDPRDMAIKLWINGELMQDSNASKLIFDMAEQIAHLSTRFTLLPGDVIATGTPSGVGLSRGRFIAPGDEVRIEVAHIGVLTNRAAK